VGKIGACGITQPTSAAEVVQFLYLRYRKVTSGAVGEVQQIRVFLNGGWDRSIWFWSAGLDCASKVYLV